MQWLLDVNMLIAMIDSNHLHHSTATHWFDRDSSVGWCSTPTTQNAVIRIMSGPGYRENRLSPEAIGSRLAELLRATAHSFLSDDVSILDHRYIDLSGIRGSGSVTNCYLLALAVAHDLTFVTMDRRIDPAAVSGGNSHLLVIE